MTLCSPAHKKYYTMHKTCFTKTQLFNILNKVNPAHNTPSYTSKQKLWNIVNSYFLSLSCKDADESCWLNQTSINSDALVPKAPSHWKSDPNAWLSNFDILNVMSQYEEKYTDFKFLGVLPIDFNDPNGFGGCVSAELCKFKIPKAFQRFAVVYNLSPHYESGSHWVTIFFNTNPRHKSFGCFYFDSNADEIPDEILEFANSIISKVNHPKFFLHSNHIRKQFKNSECGMFCIDFLIKCLQKKSFKSIIHKKYNDDDVFKLRKKFFRHS